MEKNWLLQSERDLITAKNCTRSGDFYASAFFCHQQMASQKISQSEKLLLWVKNKLGE